MLDSLRRGALNWFAKGLLGLLVIAFAVWGIGDVIRNVGRGTLATIGGSQITVDEYRQAYQDEMASLTRRFGRRLTNEQAKLLGVEQRALARLISAAAIDHHARDLKLALSDQGMAEIIRNDPGFQGPDGKFSKELVAADTFSFHAQSARRETAQALRDAARSRQLREVHAVQFRCNDV